MTPFYVEWDVKLNSISQGYRKSLQHGRAQSCYQWLTDNHQPWQQSVRIVFTAAVCIMHFARPWFAIVISAWHILINCTCQAAVLLELVCAQQLIVKDWVHSGIDARDCKTVMTLCRPSLTC